MRLAHAPSWSDPAPDPEVLSVNANDVTGRDCRGCGASRVAMLALRSEPPLMRTDSCQNPCVRPVLLRNVKNPCAKHR